MSYLLLQANTWLLPLLHPDLPTTGAKLVTALSEWVFEYTTSGAGAKTASTPAEVADTRLECPLPRLAMCGELAGYTDYTDPQHPRPLVAALDGGLSAARAYGLVKSYYHRDRYGVVEDHPRNRLVRILDAAVAEAAAVRDVAAHLERHPLPSITIKGALPGAKRATVTVDEVIHPATSAEAAETLLRKVRAEHVGRLGVTVQPEWVPTGFEAAKAIRELAGALTGMPVALGDLPQVEWDGTRPIITDEIAALLPVLVCAPTRRWVDKRTGASTQAAPVHLQRASVTTDQPARRRDASRSSRAISMDELAASMADAA